VNVHVTDVHLPDDEQPEEDAKKPLE
jgi:uncharacterized alkaline shock family protein YloU